MPNAHGGRHGVKTLDRLAVSWRWSVRSGGVVHYVDRQSGSDANAPVLAPLDYLPSRVTVPPSTVGFTQRLGRTLIGAVCSRRVSIGSRRSDSADTCTI